MMDKKNQKPSNPPAFPGKTVIETSEGIEASYRDGMTLRDYFAAKAMQSYIVSPPPGDRTMRDSDCAKWAYEVADAMLEAREVTDE